MRPLIISRIVIAVSAATLASCSDRTDASRPADSGQAQPDAAYDSGARTMTDASIYDGKVPLADGQAPASAQVQGSYESVPFVAKGGVISRFYWTISPEPRAGVSIAITQYADACTEPRNETVPMLSIYLRSALKELGSETFTIVNDFVSGGQGDPPQGTANLFGLVADVCTVDNLDQATSGTVNLTRVTGDHIEGDFTLTFKKSGDFSGSFVLPDCWGADPRNEDDPTLGCIL